MRLIYTVSKPLTMALLYLLWIALSPSQAQRITVSTEDYKVDKALKLIVCNKTPTIPTTPQSLTLVFDQNYTYSGTGQAFQAGKEYILSSTSGNYKLYFTHFPIISFNTNGVAISDDDNRTKGTVTIADGTSSQFVSSMGIRVQGNKSRLYPKKSYNMALWKAPTGYEPLETSLFGLREDSKWLFLSMYDEPLRINNAAGWAIWMKMHKLYYEEQESGALPGIRTRYCDVFINNSYNGIYLLAEDLDPKQLKLKKTTDNGEIRGELYKAIAGTDASSFKSVFNKNELLPYSNNSITWSGYEMNYPKEPHWDNLFYLTNFIINSSDTDFKSQIAEKFNVDNLIDYYLFIHAIGATEENFGNNQYVARYKENEPHLYLPWNLDVTFGNINPTTDIIAERIGETGFYYRLLTLNPNGFKSRMKKRWFALRKGDLATPTYKKNLTDNLALLTSEGAYAREELRWPETVHLIEQNPVLKWVDKRLLFLDQYFGEFPEQDDSAVDVTLHKFTGLSVGAEKELQWITSSEKNASRFEVEFSTDGVSFNKVGQVTATGNSTTEKSYSFTHPDASAIGYYRLKVFSKDELFKYSTVVLIGGCPNPPAAPEVSTLEPLVSSGNVTFHLVAGCSKWDQVLWNNSTGALIVGHPFLTVTLTETTSYQARCRQNVGCESTYSKPFTVIVDPPKAIEGYLSTASCDVISGWAWDANKPNTPVLVEILEGQNVVAFTTADIYRPDLKAAGKGNGMHAYAFLPPKSLMDNKAHTVSARVQGSTTVLKWTPKSMTCPTTNYVPLPPTVAPLSATLNEAYSRVLPVFYDGDFGSMFYTLKGLPNGLNFSPLALEITGTPTVSGTFSLTYSATDNQGAHDALVISLIVSPSGPVTVTGNFEGYLDKVECGSIRGWVWDRNKPNTALAVEFFANGNSIGTAKADGFRQDLKDAGKGNGAHVYLFPTPASLKTGTTYSISARVQNSSYVLKWAPKSLTCPVGSRLSDDQELSAEWDNTLTVWPNPSDGHFEVRYRLEPNQPGDLVIVDMFGREWYRKAVEGSGIQKQRLTLPDLHGLFLIQLRQGSHLTNKKILIR
ncbi:MAG: T9SS type A sorting domain-containing protein, partial [Chitinophagaceae bacterium]